MMRPNHTYHITYVSVIESTASAVKRWDNAKYDVPLKQEVTISEMRVWSVGLLKINQ